MQHRINRELEDAQSLERRLRTALRPEQARLRQRVELMTQRVCADGVPLPAPRAAGLSSTRRYALLLAAAACVLVVGVLAGRDRWSPSVPAGARVEPGGRASLSEIVSQADSGAVVHLSHSLVVQEALRIDKPLRIEVVRQ